MVRYPLLRMAALAAFCAAAAAPALAQEACSRPDALGTSRVMEVNPRGGLKLGRKSYPQTLALEKGEVVLTFDDGPLPATTGPVPMRCTTAPVSVATITLSPVCQRLPSPAATTSPASRRSRRRCREARPGMVRRGQNLPHETPPHHRRGTPAKEMK